MFCFIHQMPKKMRHSLYLMDDDFRLSFMHGNYITLTNLSDDEFQRIIDQRLSPLYVSVHATDPELRGRLLGKKEPAPILPHLQRLAKNRVSVHAQIVLCPGVNDGEALEKTLNDLAMLHPVNSGYRSGVESVAIVPVGLTQFRERLPHLVSADRDYARQMIAVNRRAQRVFMKSIGTRFAWLSDEWRFLADAPFPGIRHYEQFPQLEDGVGTVRLFLENARRINRKLPEKADRKISATLVTAELASGIISAFADRLNQINGVSMNVCVIKNRFFGGGINIAGLMTSTDILEQLKHFPTNEVVYIPEICLRERETFLDDRTLDELRQDSGLDIRVSGIRPLDLAQELGLLPVKGIYSGDRMQ
jgi:putative radical SAM enzyme (TIGR03279 family)